MNLEVAKNEALFLMQKHGLLDLGWRFEFDNAKRRYGVCKRGSKIIGLSQNYVLLNEIKFVRNTILHEIAHALTPGHHHDEVWRAKAIEIGCTGERCTSGAISVKGKYIAVCGTCNKENHKHKKPKREYSCGYCSRSFDRKYLLNFELADK